MPEKREASLFRNGRNQAVRIPREFEFSGDRVMMQKIGNQLILEPAPRRKLADVLSTLKPLSRADHFPDVDDTLLSPDSDPLA